MHCSCTTSRLVPNLWYIRETCSSLEYGPPSCVGLWAFTYVTSSLPCCYVLASDGQTSPLTHQVLMLSCDPCMHTSYIQMGLILRQSLMPVMGAGWNNLRWYQIPNTHADTYFSVHLSVLVNSHCAQCGMQRSWTRMEYSIISNQCFETLEQIDTSCLLYNESPTPCPYLAHLCLFDTASNNHCPTFFC